MNRSEILESAKDIVTKDRNLEYGEPEDNFVKIAELWSAYLGRRVHVVDVPVMMALLKIARIKHNPTNEDCWIDLAGYAACGGEISTYNALEDKEIKIGSEWVSKINKTVVIIKKIENGKVTVSVISENNLNATGCWDVEELLDKWVMCQ